MKRRFLLMIFMVLFMLTAGCSSHKQFHSTDMPDPQAFNAHFGDMDTNGDDLVSWEEFEAYFGCNSNLSPLPKQRFRTR